MGHVGDGNFHSLLVIDPDNESDLQEAKRLADNMARYARFITSNKLSVGIVIAMSNISF